MNKYKKETLKGVAAGALLSLGILVAMLAFTAVGVRLGVEGCLR